MKILQQEIWAKKNNVKVNQESQLQEVNVKPPREVHSYREIEDLMGIRKPTYRRGKGGAMRQK